MVLPPLRHEPDDPFLLLARRLPLVGGLDAVVYGVPQEMDEGFPDLLEDGPVELDVLPLEDEPHPLFHLPREVPDEAGKPVEDLAHGDHPDPHHDVLELGGEPVDIVDGMLQGLEAIVPRDLAELDLVND